MKSMVAVLFIALSLNAFAQNEYINDAIDRGQMSKVSDDTTMEVIAHSEDGKPELAKVYNEQTQTYEVIGLGANTEEAQANLEKYLEPDPAFFAEDLENNRITYRLILAIRLKFADLVGFRIGVAIGDRWEIGFDAGSSVFISHAGIYGTYYPFAGADNGWRGLYVSARAYKSAYFAILAVVTGTSGEGVIGYKFDKKKGGFYSFVEAGINISGTNFTNSTDGTTGIVSDRIMYPVVGFGFGWQFRLNKPNN